MNTFDRENAIQNAFNIRYVALYLRKSRGEEDKDLEKHRYALLEICKKNRWKYVEYVEIASSETIEFRPKFKELLKDVEDGIYDAVLVIDYQRLGRGEIEDQGRIKRVFRDSETYIVTPEKLYNLVDETDDLLVDVRGLLANQEYKSIKKNLLRGKKIGAKLGNWTNGPAPYPYKYNPLIKGLEVNSKKNEVYQEAKNRVLNGENTLNIEFDFNNRGLIGPKGGIWHANSISRMLINEVHLGRIISNKTKGSGHKNKKTKPLEIIPRDEWLIVENCHEAVITIEEYEKLLTIIKRNKHLPKRSRSGIYALSGLIFCGKCNRMMRNDVRRTSDAEKYSSAIKACAKKDHYGNTCDNRGMPVKLLIDILNERIQFHESDIMKEQSEDFKTKQKRLYSTLAEKEHQLEKFKKSLLKIKEMYEMDDYTREEFEDRKKKRNREIALLEEEISIVQAELNVSKVKSNEEKIATIEKFRHVWGSESASEEDKNVIAKMLISRIEYTHNYEDEVNISIEFR